MLVRIGAAATPTWMWGGAPTSGAPCGSEQLCRTAVSRRRHGERVPRDAHTPEGGRHRRSPPVGGSAYPLRRLQTPTRPPTSPGSTKGCGRERNSHHRRLTDPPPVPLQGCGPRGLNGHLGGLDPYGALPSPTRQGGLEGGPGDLWPPPHRGAP